MLLAELLAVPGCLNPRPEEDPSALELQPGGDSTPAADMPAAPERESCEDNALLAGCEPPSPADANNGASAPPSEEPAEPADAGGATIDDAGGADAGAPAPSGSSVAE